MWKLLRLFLRCLLVVVRLNMRFVGRLRVGLNGLNCLFLMVVSRKNRLLFIGIMFLL